MRVWVDAANSPHPPLFAPITKKLEGEGHQVLVTARDHAQTLELARAVWPDVQAFGDESPGGRLAKAGALAGRVRALRAWARGQRPDVALSHNSYAQIVAARSLGIPSVTAMDFEHQPSNHLAFRLAQLVLVPDAFPAQTARRQGANEHKLRRYPGLKESLYLGDFEPSRAVLDELGLPAAGEATLVVARTPPSRALYHREENRLFLDCLSVLAAEDGVRCVVLARHPEQHAELERIGAGKLVVPAHAVDARSLIYAADLFLGAGGTMTREAALMGVPTVSVFAAQIPAVDTELERAGLLRRIDAAADLLPLARRPGQPRTPQELRTEAEATLEQFVAAVEELAYAAS